AREPAVAGLLRSLLLRLIAACPSGTLRVLPVDGGTVGATFAPFQTLIDAGAIPPPVTDADGLTQVLDAAEHHVRQVRAGKEEAYLLVLIASLPPQATAAALARLAALTHAGAESRVHVILCGYPTGGSSRRPPLENTALLSVRDQVGQLGNPAGEPYGEAGLNAQIQLDPAPSPQLVTDVSNQLA